MKKITYPINCNICKNGSCLACQMDYLDIHIAKKDRPIESAYFSGNMGDGNRRVGRKRKCE